MTATLTTQHAVSSDGTAIGAHVGGAGSPLVLVHGSAADGTRWAPIREQLAERYTVHAVDRRGRGLSGDGAEYSIAREYEDLAAYVDALGEPAVVLGHSYGAVIALEAMRLTANVASLVLYEPPLPVGIEIYDPSLVARLEALLASGDRDALLTTFMREVPRVPAAHIDTMRSQDTWGARVAAAHTIPRELRAVNELEGGVRTRFAGMGVRTLLLVGGASPAFLTEASRVLAETLPDVRTVVFDGHGHSAMDTATAEFAEHVLAFAEGAAQR